MKKLLFTIFIIVIVPRLCLAEKHYVLKEKDLPIVNVAPEEKIIQEFVIENRIHRRDKFILASLRSPYEHSHNHPLPLSIYEINGDVLILLQVSFSFKDDILVFNRTIINHSKDVFIPPSWEGRVLYWRFLQ